MDPKQSYLLEDDDNPILEEIQTENPKEKLTALQKEKKQLRKNIKITAIAMFIISLLLIGFGLIWQRRYDLWAISNALWLAFAFEFFVGWIFFIYNKNIISPLIHGFKVFGLMLIGRRTKESYYEYMIRIQENPIPKYIYYTIYIFALLLLIPAVITMIMIM